ncbi:MAG: biotin synthase BioB [Candidatus Gastranaerophilales bacterium]|nr:biotin synthase BioB [Candidatus Gastranaerophilales bacterium]MCM1073004.1 biotin synthase BioB [Bacteroides sp.]
MNKNELLKLYDLDLEELIAKVEKLPFNRELEVCSIISAKTGKCGENCKYCSQSIHNHAEIHCHPLLEVEEVRQAALKAKENGATRFCIVTSGRGESGKDFEKILEMIKAVASIEGIHCCASLGLLTEEQIKQIKEAGVERFNHNINTSKNYHEKICTTHTFEDRINTVKMITKNGIEACTGVIIGMGETREDRVDMALALAELNPKTVPINVLNPIKGTPLEDYEDKITEEEVLKTICIFRLAMPKTILRYAGGRNTRLSEEAQLLGLKAGINGLLAGDYLTTKGNEISKDILLK